MEKRKNNTGKSDSTAALGPGPKEDQATQSTRYAISECMSCGCCLEACPQFNLEEDESEWDELVVALVRLYDALGGVLELIDVNVPSLPDFFDQIAEDSAQDDESSKAYDARAAFDRALHRLEAEGLI